MCFSNFLLSVPGSSARDSLVALILKGQRQFRLHPLPRPLPDIPNYFAAANRISSHPPQPPFNTSVMSTVRLGCSVRYYSLQWSSDDKKERDEKERNEKNI